MIWERSLGIGSSPDVCVTADRIGVTWTGTPMPYYTCDHQGGAVRQTTQPTGYFPKTNGRVVLYHDGVHFSTWVPFEYAAIEDGIPVGNNPTGISPSGRRFFQRHAGGIFPETAVYHDYQRVADYRPTGIWECHDDGSVLMKDFARGRMAWPGGWEHVCGPVTVKEGQDGGTLVEYAGHVGILAPGDHERRDPRVSVYGTTVAIVSWGAGAIGVRLWVGDLADVAALPAPGPVVPPAELQDIAPFASHFWAGAYKDFLFAAPANVAFAVEPPRVDRVIGPALIAPVALPHVALEQVIGWSLGHEDITETTAAALACKAMKDVPVYAYMGGYVPESRVNGVEYPILQAYRMPGCETAAAILAQLRADLARCAYSRVGLAIDLTARTLVDGVPWSEADRIDFLCGVADLCREIRPVAVIAWAWERRVPQAGISSSSIITEQWRRFVAAIPPPPEPPVPPPPEPPVEPPIEEGPVLPSDKIVSPSQKYELDIQDDGNLVVYGRSGRVIWTSGQPDPHPELEPPPPDPDPG